MTMRVCAEPGCPELTNAGRCTAHKRRRDWSVHNARNRAKRGTAAEIEAQKKRVAYRDGRFCRVCGRPDTLELDHVEPLHRGGSREDANCQLLCHEHHLAKTAAERRRG